MAKVKYIGSKPKITISLPPDAKTRSQVIETVTFHQTEEKEMKDFFAEKLIAVDKNFEIVGALPKVEKPKVEKPKAEKKPQENKPKLSVMTFENVATGA